MTTVLQRRSNTSTLRPLATYTMSSLPQRSRDQQGHSCYYGLDAQLTHLSAAKLAILGARLDGKSVMQAIAFCRSTFQIL